MDDALLDATRELLAEMGFEGVSLERGGRDGSLASQVSAEDAADVVFNTACWGYVHLRARHRWSRKRARTQVRALVLTGVFTASSSPGPSGSFTHARDVR